MRDKIDDEKVMKAAVINCLLYYDAFQIYNNRSLRENIYLSRADDPQKWAEMMENDPVFMTGGKAYAIIDEIMNNDTYANLKVVAHTFGEELDDFKDDIEDGKTLGMKSGGPVIMALEDEKNKEVTFVFRGTNALEWLDNAEGFVCEDSKLQKHALDFFENVIEKNGYADKGYNINVTGHSKGANKAQYVTIASRYDVNECISYDGQGFSKEFLEKYKDAIEQRADRITTIAADYDYVNVLGKSIAGDKQVFETNEKDINHKDYSFMERIATLGSKVDLINFALAHSPGAIIHMENDKLALNERVEKCHELPQELADMSSEIIDTADMDDKREMFYGVMSALQKVMLSDKNQEPIVGKEEIYNLKQIANGFEKLKEKAKEGDYNKAAKLFRTGELATKVIDKCSRENSSNKIKEFSSKEPTEKQIKNTSNITKNARNITVTVTNNLKNKIKNFGISKNNSMSLDDMLHKISEEKEAEKRREQIVCTRNEKNNDDFEIGERA